MLGEKQEWTEQIHRWLEQIGSDVSARPAIFSKHGVAILQNEYDRLILERRIDQYVCI